MIIFCDFDRTFYFEHDIEKTNANLMAVKGWKAAGNQFSIVTGRSFGSLKHQCPELVELCDYLILDGGSLIYGSKFELRDVFSFSDDVLCEIEKASKAIPFAFMTLYYTPDYEGFEKKSKNVTKIRLWFRELSEAERALRLMEGLPLFSFICRKSGTSWHVELNGFTCFVELIPKDSGKAKAVEITTKGDNLPLDKVIVVGDSKNDFDMIKDFGGYMIAGSDLEKLGADFKSVPSLAYLIDKKLGYFHSKS